MSKLETFIGKQIASAERSDATRVGFLDRYLGEKYGDEVDGRSQVVTSEVFDVVESITAEMMDVLTGADRIVTFRPRGPEDEEAAEDETDACNAVFWERNPGFENLQTWVKAGLIEQVGYVRSGWSEIRDIEIEEFRDVPAEAVALYVMQREAEQDVESVELLMAEQGEDGLVHFKAKVTRKQFIYDIDPLPQDQVLITPRWRKQSLQDCPFVAIKDDTKTRSDLIAMGFHREDVDELCEGGDNDARFEAEDNTEQTDSRKITIYETYVLWDIDGDGIDERLRCWVASDKGKLLRWDDGSDASEEVDSVPVFAWTPILVPHRHAGRGVAEITDDIQRQNTVLMRSLFDSIYATIYPRPEVATDGATPDTWADLARPDHGAPIRVKTSGTIQWQKAPSILGDLLPVMGRMDGIKEERTGVSKLAQGLDKDTLNKTAAGQAVLMSQSQKRIKLIARNMAEYGLKDLFVGMHRDLRKGNWPSVAYRRANGWKEAVPQQWPARSDMAVSIGTGNGDRAEKQQTLMMVIDAQRELLAAGSMMVDEANLYASIDRLVRMGGFPTAAPFFLDPNSDEYKQKAQEKAREPGEPDAMTLAAQAEMRKAEAEMVKAQVKAKEITQKGQIDIANLQAAEARAEREHQERVAKLQLDTETARLKVAEAVDQSEREDRKVDLQEAEIILDEDFRRDELSIKVDQDLADRVQQVDDADRQERVGFFSRFFGGRS